MICNRKPKMEKGAQSRDIIKGPVSMGETSSGSKEDPLPRDTTNQARWERAKSLLEGKQGGEGTSSPQARIQQQVVIFNRDHVQRSQSIEPGNARGDKKGRIVDRKRSRSPMRINGGAIREPRRGLDHDGDTSE